MARYRLTAPHYIYTLQPTEWEQKELDQTSGKEARKRYNVPLYLDPGNVADHNYPGEIIISTKEDVRYRRDYIVVGSAGKPFSPTPDLEPLDEEAETEINKHRSRWVETHPIESLPSTIEKPRRV